MTSLNDPVHQREIEKKRVRKERQILKERRNEYGSNTLLGFDSVCRYDGGAACVFF
mgnify:CR=1 FL=1